MTCITENNTFTSGGRESERFQIGTPNDTAQNVTLITGYSDNWVIDFNSVNASIKTGKGNETIDIGFNADNSTVKTGSGDTLIKIYTPNRTTVRLGKGKTTIDVCQSNKVANLTLDISKNDDYEINYYGASANVTLMDGEDNYTIRGTTGENVFDYTIPGSNLVIVSYGGEDLINVEQPIGEAKVRDDDVYIPVEGGGSITVKNGRAHTLNINGQETIIGGYASGITPQEVIKNFMYALTETELQGMDALDEAIRKSSPFKDTRKVIKRMVNDCRLTNDADKFLRKYCNIILDNADTGSISGWDAGTSYVKTAESVVKEYGKLQSFYGNSFTVNGLKVFFQDNPENLGGVKRNIAYGLYTWWIKSALDLIEKSYGSIYRFDSPRSTINKILVNFYNNNGNFLSSIGTSEDNNGNTYIMTLDINLRYYGSINAGDPDGHSTDTPVLFDRNLAHEFTHAVMAANIKYFYELPSFIKEGSAELVHGIADKRREDIETLAGDWEKLESALTNFSINSSDVVVEDVCSPAYAGGYMFLQYFAKKVATMSWD